jgi:ribosomal protein S18 acetylase RimI-like enzyme
MEITKAGIESIPIIQHIANITWSKAYKEIITNEQLEYMLNKMYSADSLKNQIQVLEHQFILANFENKPVGFASFNIKQSIPEKIVKLHKIYVDPSRHGKGIGKSMLQYIMNEISLKGLTYLELNVNRQNTAIGFYKKLGFKIIAEEDIPIGNGFFMNDYVMQISC